MANEIYAMDAVSCAGSGAFTIDNLQDIGIDVGNTVVGSGGGNRLTDRLLVIMRQEAVLRATTANLTTALTKFGFNGLSIDGSTISDCAMFYKKREPNGVGYASSGHHSVLANAGYMAMPRISLADGQIATGQIEVHVISPTGAAPLVFAAGATLPAQVSVDEIYTLGKVTAAGVTIDNIVSVEIDMGLKITKGGHSGLIYPRTVQVDKQSPTFTVRTKNLGNALTFAGAAMLGTQSLTDCVVYMRRKETFTGVGDIADGETSHVSFTMSKWQSQVQELPAGQDDDATASIVFTALDEGATTFVIGIGVVIP